jgi:hypothetical protein
MAEVTVVGGEAVRFLSARPDIGIELATAQPTYHGWCKPHEIIF